MPTHYLLSQSRVHQRLHSSPTRRSSDLAVTPRRPVSRSIATCSRAPSRAGCRCGSARSARSCRARRRAEEHTSELQSLTKLVCRLLLEKKKKKCLTVRADLSLAL